MPALAADSFTASSSVLGKRIFTRSVLGWNSNNTVRSCERSYSVKSVLATNASASSSVSSFGNFFFIIVDLLPAHVAGIDWPDQCLAVMLPQREDDQHCPPVLGPADRLEPLLALGVLRVGEYSERAVEQALNDGNRDAVLPAFFAVPAIPIEPDNRRDHAVMYFCTYKRRATVCPYQVSSEGADKLPPSRFRRRCS